jgi:hypothetical protein
MKSAKESMPVWTLQFRAADAGPAPMAIRIRRALKYALRQCGLRCVDHRIIASPNPPQRTEGTTADPIPIRPADAPESILCESGKSNQ